MKQLPRLVCAAMFGLAVGCHGQKVPPSPGPSAQAEQPPALASAPADAGSASPPTGQSLQDAVTALYADMDRLHPELALAGSTSHQLGEGATVTLELDSFADHFVFVFARQAVVAQPNANALPAQPWMLELPSTKGPLVQSTAVFGPRAGTVRYQLASDAWVVRYRRPIAALVEAEARRLDKAERESRSREVHRVCGQSAIAACQKKGCQAMVAPPRRKCPGGVRPPPDGYPEDRAAQAPSCLCLCGDPAPEGPCPPMP